MKNKALKERKKYPSWQRRHEIVLNWFLENPCSTNSECADATNYTQWHISRIINSPEFKKRYEVAMKHKRKLIFEEKMKKDLAVKS